MKIHKLTINAPTIFKIKPNFTIFEIFIKRLEYIIAFGGVAIGSIKAKLAETITPITGKNTSIFILCNAPIIIGTKVIIVAVFELISVKNTIDKIIEKVNKNTISEGTKLATEFPM